MGRGNSDGFRNCLSSYSSRKVTLDLLIFLDYISHLLLETLITIDLRPTFFRCDALILSLFFIAVSCELGFLEFLVSLLQCQVIDAFRAQSLGVLKCVPSIWLCSCHSHCVFQMAKLACMQIYGGFVKYCLCHLSNFVYDPQAQLVDLCPFVFGVTSPAV